MIHWAALGIFLKATSWPVAYLFMAKGNTKLYFYSELSANIYMLGFNVIGYQIGGLEGLGISFFVGYLVYLFQVFLLANWKYSFSFGRSFSRIFFIQFLLGILCFLSSRLLASPYIYFVGSMLILLSGYFSFRELNKRLQLIPLILERFNKKK